MMNVKNKIFMIAAVAAIVLASCGKKDSTPVPVTPPQTVTANNIMADTVTGLDPVTGQPLVSGKFTLYNLETNSIISNNDSATNKWDLGFRGTTIITNSGTSGPGNGGAFIYVGTFESLTEVSSDSSFKTDNTPAYAITTGSNNGWYNYNPTTNLITPIPGRVLVIRTASGKYAKVEILNYYKGGVTPDASATDEFKLQNQRYYTFRYILQADGSKKFN